MKNKPNYSEFVHKYLSGELNPQEHDAFEREISKNNQLKQELEFQKRLDQIILDDELENFKLALDQVSENLVITKSRKRSISVAKLSLVAATILIIVALGVVFFNNNDKLSDDEIFNNYYTEYPSPYRTRANDLFLNSQYLKAMECYDMKDYISAKHGLISAVKDEPNNIASKFYLGIVSVELNEFHNAIKCFDEVIKSRDQFYLEQSEWYKALCFFKVGNRAEAFKQLGFIANKNGYYQANAAEIISLFQ